jgi:UDP-N-acetylmuramyl tripeptide synthase
VSLRLTGAVAAGKAVAHASRLLRLGGGTVLPGRVARWVFPPVLERLAASLEQVVVVSGTNGKTTTARLLARMLESGGIPAVHNRAGANLQAGLVASLLLASDVRGRPRCRAGVFEVDEATLPTVADALRPGVVVLTNLFRDQLDRYAELERVAEGWRRTLGRLPSAVVCYNADDPQVADVAQAARRRLAFGIEDSSAGRTTLEEAADVRHCYRCGVAYRYEVVFLSHAGHYACPSCEWGRPTPEVRAERVRIQGTSGFEAELAWGAERLALRSRLPGLYNVYNVLAAAAAARCLGLSGDVVRQATESVAPAFGRGERLAWGGVSLQILLVKNPAGFNEVLRLVVPEKPRALLVAIHDRTADGRDVSWLWDVEFEQLCGLDAHITLSGIRAEEVALRLKYAGWPEERTTVEKDLARALQRARQATPPGGVLFCLPTYTAMLELRKILTRFRAAAPFWED